MPFPQDEVSPAIVIDRLRLIYLPVPKAACSSIKAALRQVLGMPPCNPWWKIHETPWPRIMDRAIVPEEVQNSYRIFTVVRNPWDRLWSVYKDKFRPDKWVSLQSHHNELRMDMTFTQFVKALTRMNVLWANEHIRPQTCLIPPAFLTLLKYEQLKEKWHIYADQVGLPSRLPVLNVTGGANYRQAYNEYTRDAVKDIYREDIINFDYSFC